MRTRGCGFTEFLSGERSIGFCLDKAQLSGRPMQIQDCPGLQEVLVGESGAFFFLCVVFFPLPAHFSLLRGFQQMQSTAESGLFLFCGGSFSPMIGWRQLGAFVWRYQRHRNLTAFMSPTRQEIAALAHRAHKPVTVTDAHTARSLTYFTV